MLKKIGMLVLFSTLAAGCASVPLETAQINKVAKQFDPPSDGKAGLYIYRNTFYGGAAHTDVMVDGYCIGSSAPYVFFYEEVEGDKSHKVSTEPEFSPNDLLIKVKSGMNYFFQQYLRMIGGTGVDLVDEEQGKEEVSKLDMAAKVGCGRMHSNKPSFAKTNIPAIEKLDQDYHGDMQKKVQQSPISSDQKTAWYTAIQKLEAGNQFQKNGAYDKAIENFQQALTLFRKIGAEEWIATSLGNIGNVYNSRGQYDKAIENYQQALTIARKLGSENMVSKSLMNIEKAKKNIILKEAKE